MFRTRVRRLAGLSSSPSSTLAKASAAFFWAGGTCRQTAAPAHTLPAVFRMHAARASGSQNVVQERLGPAGSLRRSTRPTDRSVSLSPGSMLPAPAFRIIRSARPKVSEEPEIVIVQVSNIPATNHTEDVDKW